MRAAEMAAASLGLGSALSPVFVRPNSTSLRALVSGSAGIGGEIAALRAAVEGRAFVGDLSAAELRTALLADGAHELFNPGPCKHPPRHSHRCRLGCILLSCHDAHIAGVWVCILSRRP